MLAHKCDVCGTYYTKPGLVHIWENQGTSTEIRSQVHLMRTNGHTLIDLCESCAKELEGWINDNGKAQNDSD